MKMTDKERAYYEWRRANWKSMSAKDRVRHPWNERNGLRRIFWVLMVGLFFIPFGKIVSSLIFELIKGF
jgi:hypothetical protein